MKYGSNSDYMIDMAARHCNQVKMENLIEEVESDLTAARPYKAHDGLVSYNKIEMGVGEGIDVLQDEDAIRRAFDTESSEKLINFPGALGEFFKSALERGGFIAFQGKKNVGKSWWLQEFAFQGMLQRKRVAMFEVGDMGEAQIMRRFMIRAAKQPRFPKAIDYPIKIWRNKKDRIECEYDERDFTKRLSWRKAKKLCERIMQKKVRSTETYLKL